MASRKPIDLSRYSDLLYDASKNNFNSPPVYGPFEKLCLSDWGQSEIHLNISKAFDKMNIRRMSPLQQNSFLYLMNNYNTAMVGFSKGKSTSYLASIFSLILNSKDNDNNQKSNFGPKAIILSSSLGSCSELEDLSKQLLYSSNGKIKVVVAYSSVTVQKTIAFLCNGCDVFIATPSSFEDLLSKTKLFSWSNLKHIVFDNIDLLLENYSDQMVHFSRIIPSIKEKISDLQMISVSVKWTHKIHTFLSQLFSEWQYIFGSHLEAARYMNVKFSVVPAKENKLEKIIENLKCNINWHRCVLVTANPKQLVTIFKYTRKTNNDIEILLPDEIKSAKVYTLQKWTAPSVNNKVMLICSDDMLYDFYIDNADCLIHYDIPAKKQAFSTRFSVLQDSTNSLTKIERNTYIYLSNSNKDMLELPKIVDIMKVFGNGNVPPVLLKNSKLINESLEKEKKNRLLCSSLLQFGSCPRPIVCQNRHIVLKDIDEPINFPKSGLAIVQILNLYDASHISAKILKLNCTNNLNDQHWTTFRDDSDIIDEGLTMLYDDPHLRKLHKNPVIGDLVAVHLENKRKTHKNTVFYRAIVVDFLENNSMNPKLMVKLIDLGYVDIVSKWKVYSLPDKWKELPSSTADLFLISVKPVDFDKTWCSKANLCVRKQLQYAQDCNSTFIVKITMALGTTIWVKKLYQKCLNPVSAVYEFKPILPDILFDNSYADVHPEHLDKLTELCAPAGIELPLPLPLIINDAEENPSIFSLDDFMSLYKLPQPQWAHLDENITTVSLEYVISPNFFFVLNAKYYDRILVLEKKITEFIQNKKVEKLTHIVEGAICLAKRLKQEEYCRCKIVNPLNDNGYIEVFFVDLGDFEWVQPDSLLTIHPDLITQLPFQVIECGLSGVKDELPSGEELDKLVDYLFNSSVEYFDLKVINTVSLGKFTSGNHYEVMLFNGSITVNFDFMKEFGQYCDEVQMEKLKQLQDNEDTLSEAHDEEPCVIPETPYVDAEEKIENVDDNDDDDDDDNYNDDDYLIPEEDILLNRFYNEFLFPFYKVPLKSKIKKKVRSAKYLAVKVDVKEPVTAPIENKGIGCSTAIKPIEKSESHDVQCVVPIDCEVPAKQIPIKNYKLKFNMRRQDPCFTCNSTKHSVIVPICTWYQDSSNIYLKFNILEIDEIRIDRTMRSITLNAQFKDIIYTFNANLYGSIIDASETHKLSYEGFHIKVEKLYKTDYKWPRLLLCHKWHRYLKYDPEHLDTHTLGASWTSAIKRLKIKAGVSLKETCADSDSSDCCEDVYDFDEMFDY